jgi:protein-S-isoprenylcysteine O-methyltransferase Ste14
MNQPTNKPTRAEEHPWGDAGQVIFVIVFFVVWIVDSFFLKQTTFLAIYLPAAIRVLLCVLSSGLGFALLRTHTVDYEKLGTSVITEGPYRLVRHPVYMAVLLILLGPAISTLSIAGVVVWLLFFVFYNTISAYEESILREKFGKEYTDYMEKVARWIPKIGRE